MIKVYCLIFAMLAMLFFLTQNGDVAFNKQRLIKRADTIAVVKIQGVTPATGQAKADGYLFRADAETDYAIKGELPKYFIMYSTKST